MRSAVSGLTLVRAASLEDALRRLADTPSLTPLAGCTDLYVSLNFGTLESRAFIDIGRLRELRYIDAAADTLRLGALCTYTDLIRSRDVQQRLPMLVAAAREIGGVQIQNRGTIGGNIANGSPAGDTLPVLAAAEAVVVLQSAQRTRRVPFTEFHTGYRRSVLEPGELIVAVEAPRVAGRQWFRKVGTRAAQAISKIVMAGVRAERSRVAIGSVAPTVLRLYDVESALASGAAEDEAVRALDGAIAPIDDIRSTALYRRRVAANLLRRFLSDTA